MEKNNRTIEKRIILITGANSGIGRAAALRFANAGDTVIMGCRSRERAAPEQQEIIRATGNRSIALIEVDMSSQDSIRTFAHTFQRQYSRLDVLIHNAAYFNHGEPYRVSPDGIEIAFATNVVGPYLLTDLLLDRLRKSRDPRVLYAGSNITKHYFDPRRSLDLDTIRAIPTETEKRANVYSRYCRSKMALLLLTLVSARKDALAGIAVNYLQINGARMSAATVRKFSLRYRLVAILQNLFLKPPEYMANVYYEITTNDRFHGMTGIVFNDELNAMTRGIENAHGWTALRQVTGKDRYPALAAKTDVQEKIWDLCEAPAATGVYHESPE